MNTFRHPANAKLFTIFFGCLLAAIAFNKIQKNEVSEHLQKNVWVAISTVFVCLLIWGIAGHHSLSSFKINNLKYFLDNLSFSDLLLINICIQIPFIYIIYLTFSKKINHKTLLFASIINCTIHTALFQPFTVVKKDSSQAIQKILNSVEVNGYPFPDLHSSIKNNSKNGDSLFNEIGTLNMYNKKIGRIPYRITPSNLLSQNSFWNKEDLKRIILQYPFLYRADTAIKNFESTLTLQNHYIVVIDQDSIRNKVNHFQKALFECSITKFSPNEWVMNIKNPQDGFYTMFQNYYPRWKLMIDGKEQKIVKSNISFMGFEIPAGNHTLVLYYRSLDIKIAFLISILSGLSIIILIAKRWRVYNIINSE